MTTDSRRCKPVKWLLATHLAACVAFAAVGNDEKCPVSANVRGHENIEWSISYAYGLTDATRELPRVLLVGDSICNGYQSAVRERLKGKMNVTYWVSSYCVTSPAYLPLLSIYLDEAKYDVVHFNNGLHSLQTPTAAYENGMRRALALIRRKQPDAKIVWCSSTPLANDAKTAKCRELNAAAARAAAEAGCVATDDLFALCDPLDRAANWSDEFHFRPEAKAKQAEQVAASVLSARYAGTYPDAVSRIYLDAPLLDFSTAANKESWSLNEKYGIDVKTYVGKDDPRQPVNMYEPIAKAGIPILLLYGGADATVPPSENCLRFANAFKGAGGNIDVVARKHYGHHPHGLEIDEQQKFVDFFNGK